MSADARGAQIVIDKYLRFKIFNDPINIPYQAPLKILIMENDSWDRSIQVQDGENNDSGEQSPIPVSQERHRNEEKDSLANRKQESQSSMTKIKKKSRKRKVSTSEEDLDSSSTDYSPPAKKKKKAKHGRHHQPTSSSSTASNSSPDEESHNDRFKIITENEKLNYPKVGQLRKQIF